MSNTTKLLAPALLVLSLTGAELGCQPTRHPAVTSSLGVASTSSALEAVVDQPGPVTVETVIGADWEVPRSGLLNLDNPKSKAAQLIDGPVPIHIALHAIRHPTAGLFLVDTGVERALRDDPRHAALHGVVASFMHTEKMKFHVDTKTFLDGQPAPPAGVFLTHIHMDHVSGMPDVPDGTPVYTGPGDNHGRSFQNLFVKPVLDEALAGKGTLREWSFREESNASFEGVVDVFNDGTVWALWVPGHTPGSTAFLVRTPSGPVLMVGDACHTSWGWENGVEPGTYSADIPRSADSLARLKRFVDRHPSVDVRLGHQLRGSAS